MRYQIQFTTRVTRPEAKDILLRHHSSIEELEAMGKVYLGAGQYLAVFVARARTYIVYNDENKIGGLLDVGSMPEEVRDAALDQMERELGLSRDELLAELATADDSARQRAVLHALAVG